MPLSTAPYTQQENAGIGNRLMQMMMARSLMAQRMLQAQELGMKLEDRNALRSIMSNRSLYDENGLINPARAFSAAASIGSPDVANALTAIVREQNSVRPQFHEIANQPGAFNPQTGQWTPQGGPLVPPQDQPAFVGEKERQESLSKAVTKMEEGLSNESAASSRTLPILKEMKNLQLDTTISPANRWKQPLGMLLEGLGFKSDEVSGMLGTSVDVNQVIQKLNAKEAAGDTRAITSRPAVFEYQNQLANNPSAVQDPKAYGMLVDNMIKNMSVAPDRQKFYNSWKGDKNNEQRLNEFEPAWTDEFNKRLSGGQYQVGVPQGAGGERPFAGTSTADLYKMLQMPQLFQQPQEGAQ